ncbi:MAG: hydrogenase maturation nickel metallochaperone HypA [Candidatus Omnitrophica bacterium]|nr:hydrogenase maturation nickel metallochaperone HypA [Candidatus Omnitrophota bacterium]
MHEMHLIKSLFNDLLSNAKEQEAGRVTKVFLRMGEFTEINEEIIRFFFVENSKGTVVEGAELIIEKSPNRELSLLSFDCE